MAGASASGARRTQLAGRVPPTGLVGAREEVARGLILLVGHGGGQPAGQRRQSVQQRVDVLGRVAEAGAGPNGARRPAMVALEDFLAVGIDGGRIEAKEPDHVRVGTEAAVTDGDAELGTEPGGHEGVVHALDGERHDRQ